MKASLEVLMDGLIDYAGLFPPASLDMHTAVRQYAKGRQSEQARWLGRFVVPASRLKEFARAHEHSQQGRSSGDSPWQLAALVGNDLAGSLSRLTDFDRDRALHRNFAAVDSLEMTVDSVAAIPSAMKKIPVGLTHYFEIPIQEDPSGFLLAIGQAGARAKIRTGGVRGALFPSSGDLARLLAACHRAGVGFKATAGLHHPVRAIHRLTYASDSPTTVMHGFLNVFLAAGFAANGMDVEILADLLEDESPDAFSFRDDAALWRGHRVGVERIGEMRRKFAFAFGSCSFEEPQQGLREMGLL